MKKIIDFFKSQSKKTKNLFLFGLGTYAVYALYAVRDTGHILEQRGLLTFLTVVSGEIIRVIITSIPVLLVSLIIAIIPYYIFRGIAREYKRFLDYVAIFFLILSVIIIFGVHSNQKNAQNYELTDKANLKNNLIISGFTQYDLSEDNLSVYLPQTPEKQEIEINNDILKKMRYYTALSKDEFIKYIIFVPILNQKILSQKSTDAWLENILKSKIANHKNPEMKIDKYIQYKGVKSRLYSFTSENESGETIMYKAIEFIYNGQPFGLEIIYPTNYNDNTYWDEFIESVELQ